MVSWNAFLASVISPTGLGRLIQQDPGQLAAVQAPPSESLHIIAGPGTGKTTALTLRILKLTMVDRIDPGEILATTFTKKAANELRSRILGWGDRLKNHVVATNPGDRAAGEWLRTLDYNRVITG